MSHHDLFSFPQRFWHFFGPFSIGVNPLTRPRSGQAQSIHCQTSLKKHPRRLDSPDVFYNGDGEPFADVDNAFATALRKSGFPHFRFHDMGHTFASWLVMGGVDLRTVQEWLGHKDIRMTMRYAHLAPNHMRRAVSILGGGAGWPSGSAEDILDSRYLHTKGLQNEKQGVAVQA